RNRNRSSDIFPDSDERQQHRDDEKSHIRCAHVRGASSVRRSEVQLQDHAERDSSLHSTNSASKLREAERNRAVWISSVVQTAGQRREPVETNRLDLVW